MLQTENKPKINHLELKEFIEMYLPDYKIRFKEKFKDIYPNSTQLLAWHVDVFPEAILNFRKTQFNHHKEKFTNNINQLFVNNSEDYQTSYCNTINKCLIAVQNIVEPE